MPQDGRTPSTGCIGAALGIIAAVIGSLFLISGVTGDDSEDDDAAPSSPSVTEAPPTDDADPTTVDVETGEYAITYRVEFFSGDNVLVSTEVRTHRAPFEAEVLLYDGEPDDRGELSERTTQVMGGYETASPADEPVVLAIVPGVPGRIAHFGGDLAAAVDQGTIEPLGQRVTIGSTDCDVYRTRSPLDVGLLESPTDDEFTDLCIAADGLVLREEWHTAGTLLRRRTAVDVDRSPDLDDSFELTGHRIPDAVGGGRVRQLQPDSTAPGVDHLLPATMPDGYSALGRYVYVSDRPDTGVAELNVDRIASLVDVFVSGDDIIVVENGHADAPQVPETGGVPVDIAGAGGARAFVHTNHNVVVIGLDGGRYVRLTGTIAFDDLVALAENLTPAEGTGEVVPLDDEELDITGRLAPEDAEADEPN